VEHEDGKNKDSDAAFDDWNADPGIGMDIDIDMDFGGAIFH
jgi:hypothetical protein